jgi:dTDP-4-amino-4,6-dideoxygalactose transaminase
MQAALALAGLPYVERGIQKRAALAEIYERHFRHAPGLRVQRPGFSCRSSHKDFAIVVDEARFGISRQQLEQTLAADNIETRRYFDPPLHLQPLYRSFHEPGGEPLPVTERISTGVLCLPLHAGLEGNTVGRIAERVLSLACGPGKESTSQASMEGPTPDVMPLSSKVLRALADITLTACEERSIERMSPAFSKTQP